MSNLGDISLLPFLKRNTAPAGLIVQTRKSDENTEAATQPDDELDVLANCIEDFMKAFRASDKRKMALILKLAHETLHEYMDAEPSDESFAAQNIKAAEQSE